MGGAYFGDTSLKVADIEELIEFTKVGIENNKIITVGIADNAITTAKLDISALILNMTISSGETVNVQTGKHLQYLTAGDNVLTIDGILQIDGSFVFTDLGV